MRKNRIFCLSLYYLCGALLLSSLSGFTVQDVFAGEKGATAEWRHTYDLIMLWVNFGILSFILVKFGKKPIMNFLRAQKDELAEEIGSLEQKKESMISEINKTRQALQDSDARFAELREKIIRMGEQKRDEIITQAQQQSEMMMEIAKQKIGNRILVAKREFKAELVDNAFDMATERIPKEMTDEDNEKLVQRYLSAAYAD